jgi:hypothetical protein
MKRLYTKNGGYKKKNTDEYFFWVQHGDFIALSFMDCLQSDWTDVNFFNLFFIHFAKIYDYFKI